MTQGNLLVENSRNTRVSSNSGHRSTRVARGGRGINVEESSRRHTGNRKHKERLKYNATRNQKMPLHGDRVRRKKTGHVRIFYENVDGMVPVSEQNLSTETKIARLKGLFRNMEIDVAAFSEVRMQWNMASPTEQLGSIFKSEAELRTIAGFNEHEQFTKNQQGGTCMLVGGTLASNVMEMGADDTGLGRWCWVRFKGQDGYTSRIITAYQPCRSGRIEGNTTYAQQRRYFRSKGDTICPLIHFRQDLEQELLTWRREGDRLLMIGDFNENCQQGHIQKIVTTGDLKMVDVIQSLTKRTAPPTWFQGKNQIDAAFATQDFSVSRGCFLPFFVGVGDHRGIVLDIPHESLLGMRVITVARPTARRLQCTPKVQKIYTQRLEQYCQSHKILTKTKDLVKALSFPLSAAMCQELNGLDNIRKIGMRHAELKCRKLMMGNVDFSPEVTLWGRRAYLWKLVLRAKDGRKISRSKIKRLAKSCGVQRPLSHKRKEVQKMYQKARREYLRRKPHAAALRERFLEKSVKDGYLNGDEKKVRQLKTILKREAQRKSWRAINLCTKPGRMSGVSRVEVKVNGHWIREDRQYQIERAIMCENSSRFRLTENTPLMAGPMQRELGYLSNTIAAQQILDGTYTIPEGVDEFTASLLRELIRPENSQVDTRITTEDFQRYWRCAREKTASSLSGLHFGHYKAASTSYYLSSIHALLTSIASTFGFSYDRWRQGLSVMLEKVDGVIRVDKLRAILLMEADFNFHNKEIFGRRMIQKAESEGALPQDQYGSRKNHRAIEVAFNRLMYFDILRLKRRNGALASVDAAQCYDRIVHSMLSLCCQYYGVPISAVLCMLSAIQTMKFYLRTAYGDSKSYYGGSSRVPFQGTCQGNGASPAIWLVVSSLIIRSMSALGHNTEFLNAFSLVPVSFVAFAFVDDTDLPLVADNSEEPVENVIQSLQNSIMAWNSLLSSTGGALRPEKCFWYLIWFKWNSDGQWRYATTTDNTQSISVPDSHGVNRAIQKLEVTSAREAVGCMQRADGKMNDELVRCQHKLNSWATKVKSGNLPRKLVWQGFRGQLWTSIQYRLSVTTFSRQESDMLIKNLYQDLLPSLGMSRNFPLVYRYSSFNYFGLNLPHPYIEQGIAAVEMLLVYGNSNCLSGSLLNVAVEQFQLEVGSAQLFWHLDHKKWSGYTTRCWLWRLWEFISTYGISVHSQIKPPKYQRINDRFLMDQVHQDITDQAVLRSVNRCRLYLEVLTLADMSSGDGKRIKNSIIQLERLPGEDSKFDWPTEKPSAADKRIWRSVLASLFELRYTITPPLGMWISRGHKHHRWFFSPVTRHLYKKSPTITTSYLVYSSLSLISPRRGWSLTITGVAMSLPEDAMRATAQVVDDHTVIFEGCACTFIENGPSATSILEELKLFEHCLMFNNTDILDNGIELATAIREGNLLCISDGSYQDQLTTDVASAAWIMENISNGSQCKGVCLTPDGSSGSYRAELTGLYGILCIIAATCKVHNISTGRVQIGCDNDQCVRNASRTSEKVQQKLRSVDLVRAIRRIKSNIPVQLDFIEVTGHLDDDLEFDDLDRPSQLNVWCDLMAKRFLQAAVEQEVLSGGGIPHEKWFISLDKTKVTSSVGHIIRNKISHSEMRNHLHKKSKLSWRLFNKIDWDAIGSMMRESTTTFRVWISKHVSGFCGVGRRMKLMKYWDNSLCPCCHREEENTWHIAKCTSTAIRKKFLEFHTELKQWLRQHNTDPILDTAINEYVLGRGTRQFHLMGGRTSLHWKLEDEINGIGWDHFMEGKLPLLLGEMQWQYSRHEGLDGNKKSWIKGLVYILTRGLLSFWLERNSILHARDSNGLKLQQSQELKEQIQNQLDLGNDELEGAELTAWHRAAADIFYWSGEDQKSWLRTMEIARSQPSTVNTNTAGSSSAQTNQEKGARRKRASNHRQASGAKRQRTDNNI